MKNRNKGKSRLQKFFENFGEGLEEISTLRPQLKKLFLSEFEEGTTIEELELEDFASTIFPAILEQFNPIINREDRKGRIWEYHIASNTFHVKTQYYISFGMYYNSNQENYCFYITLFGNNYKMDEDYLLDNGWKIQDDESSKESNNEEESSTMEE